MPHLLTQDQAKRMDEIERLIAKHDVDIKRLWRYIARLEAQVTTNGQTLPPME